jgi:hypothetical protein
MNICFREAAMVDGSLQGSARDARGRFVPGQSGNPAGKLPGTCNRATLLKAALDSEEGPAMARIVIDKALAGDVVTARFCLDRLEPRPRGRTIAIDLPEGARASDVVAAFDATLRAMAAGEITPEEAVQVTRVLDGRRKAIEAARRERDEAIKPSPPGRELGDGDDLRSSKRPHPDGLPRGEGNMEKPSPSGRGWGEGTGRASVGAGKASARRPHPNPLPQGEGISSGSRLTASLLHSTCISSLSGVIGWAGAGAATSLA